MNVNQVESLMETMFPSCKFFHTNHFKKRLFERGIINDFDNLLKETFGVLKFKKQLPDFNQFKIGQYISFFDKRTEFKMTIVKEVDSFLLVTIKRGISARYDEVIIEVDTREYPSLVENYYLNLYKKQKRK